MADAKENMVLRTVYLPLGLDRELRQLAFTRDVSKADLIRDFVKQGLGTSQASGERTIATRLKERIAHRKTVVESALASDDIAETKLPARTRRRPPAKRVAVSA